MPEQTSWWREIISGIASHPAGELLTKVLEQIWSSLSPGDKRYIRFKVTGNVPLEDENLIWQARAEVRSEDGPNADDELARKLAKLPSHMQDYYRLAVVGYADPDPNIPKAQDDRRRIEAAKKIMRRHIDIESDTVWDKEIEEFNLDQKKADSVAERIERAGGSLLKVREDLGKQWDATGAPAATQALVDKLTARIKRQLS